jgi:hypothetical protein
VLRCAGLRCVCSCTLSWCMCVCVCFPFLARAPFQRTCACFCTALTPTCQDPSVRIKLAVAAKELRRGLQEELFNRGPPRLCGERASPTTTPTFRRGRTRTSRGRSGGGRRRVAHSHRQSTASAPVRVHTHERTPHHLLHSCAQQAQPRTSRFDACVTLPVSAYSCIASVCVACVHCVFSSHTSRHPPRPWLLLRPFTLRTKASTRANQYTWEAG